MFKCCSCNQIFQKQYYHFKVFAQLFFFMFLSDSSFEQTVKLIKNHITCNQYIFEGENFFLLTKYFISVCSNCEKC